MCARARVNALCSGPALCSSKLEPGRELATCAMRIRESWWRQRRRRVGPAGRQVEWADGPGKLASAGHRRAPVEWLARRHILHTVAGRLDRRPPEQPLIGRAPMAQFGHSFGHSRQVQVIWRQSAKICAPIASPWRAQHTNAKRLCNLIELVAHVTGGEPAGGAKGKSEPNEWSGRARARSHANTRAGEDFRPA